MVLSRGVREVLFVLMVILSFSGDLLALGRYACPERLKSSFMVRGLPYWFEMSQLFHREPQTQMLDKYFETNRVAVITGSPGTGKSVMAFAYAKRFLSNGDCLGTLWLISDSQSSLSEEYRNVAEDQEIAVSELSDAQIRKEMYRVLEGSTRTLVIFDDVKNEQDVQPYLEQMPSNVKVIITTRQEDLFTALPRVKLGDYNEAEVKKYLKSFFGKAHIITDDDVVMLLNKVGGLPLRLSYVTGYMEYRPLFSIKDVLEQIDQEKCLGLTVHPIFSMLMREVKKDLPRAWGWLTQAARHDNEFISFNELGVETVDLSREVRRKIEYIISDLKLMALAKFKRQKNGKMGLLVHELTKEGILQYESDSSKELFTEISDRCK